VLSLDPHGATAKQRSGAHAVEPIDPLVIGGHS
jgi:hypothetical protein